MKSKSLTETLKRFDEILGQDYDIVLSQDSATEITMGSRNKQIKEAVKQSIKDALEACHIKNQKDFGSNNGWADNLMPDEEYKELIRKGYNRATIQYDKNVRKFLGKEDI